MATVSITINAVNDAPVAVANSYFTEEDAELRVEAFEGLLANDSGGDDVIGGLVVAKVFVEGQAFSLQEGSVSVDLVVGTVVVHADGSFVYTPSGVYADAGRVSFGYMVEDEGGSTSSATVAIDINHFSGITSDGGIIRVGGSDGNDTFVLTESGGVLYNNGVPTGISLGGITEIRVWGRGGNDTIDLSALAINSYLHGGAGDDTLVGGAARDLIFGGLGRDYVAGGAGDDFLSGGDDVDRIVGSSGHDILVAGDLHYSTSRAAIDALLSDWIASRAATISDDSLDSIFSDEDFDQLTGSAGADWFIVSEGDKITDLKKNNNDGDLVTWLN